MNRCTRESEDKSTASTQWHLSLDDLYLDNDNLIPLRAANPSNKLVQIRGQPGTHDMNLARSFFESLRTGS
ncbi:hypothetical protein PDIG_29160 [Penicillium digitatum PHI26]|jgi:D-glycerate 3-kinase|uniref:Uncharacterized protein n=2 Tax=Penicillium digitatum TaxID=36651 RepID=K9G267_PEND2|nr:hypothetical protein PDIP_63590 [Penicillium digitatum Pd1]EKV09679.1 hypothetical protein PDIP_63590 [Penicillium digitatum Pd1]EKV14987.1 hypothetical protein PDIG_29160 [Penicillium digitatum PHI26]